MRVIVEKVVTIWQPRLTGQSAAREYPALGNPGDSWLDNLLAQCRHRRMNHDARLLEFLYFFDFV